MKKRKSSGPVVRQNDFCHDTEITIHKKVNYFIKIKNACSVKDTIKIMKKTNHRIGKKYFHNVFSSKDGIQNTRYSLNSAGRKQAI